MTLVATAPNLVVDAELRAQRRQRLRVLQLHAVRRAGPGAGRRSTCCSRAAGCRPRSTRAGGGAGRPRLRDWIEEYGLAGRERRVRIRRRLAAGRPDARGAAAARQVGRASARDRARGAGSRPRSSARRRPTRLRAGDVLLIDLFVARRQCRGAGARARARAAAAERRLLRRPVAGGRHGRGDAARGLGRGRPDAGALGVPHPLRRHRGRAAARQPGTLRRHHRRGAAGRRHPAGGGLLVRHPQAADASAAT